MENLICLDASPLIDHFRKKNKHSTFFFQLSKKYEGFILPVTAHFEIISGATELQRNHWDNLFNDLLIVPYQPYINDTAVEIARQLYRKRLSIEYKDLMIAATALHYNYRLATINEKHFVHIENLKLTTPNDFRS